MSGWLPRLLLPAPRTLRGRLVLFVAVVLGLIQVVNLVAVITAVRENVIAQAQEQLIPAAQVVREHLLMKARRLADTVAITAKDFGLRDAVTRAQVFAGNEVVDFDRGTLESVANNTRSRIETDRVLIVDLEAQVLADTGGALVESRFPFPGLLPRLEPGEAGEPELGFGLIGPEPHALAAVPVGLPLPVAWLVAARRLDDGALEQAGTVAGPLIEVALMSGSRLRAALPAAEPGLIIPRMLTVGDLQFIGGAVLLPVPPGAPPMAAEIALSVDGALARYAPLQLWLVVLLALGLAVTLAGSLVVAGGITRPLNDLAAAAQRAEAGDYMTPVVVPQVRELAVLAASFNAMMAGIASREETIRRQAETDLLTGLPNRLALQRRLALLAETADESERFALVALGLGRLDEIIGTLGHAMADQLVRAVVPRLASHTQPPRLLAHAEPAVFHLLIPGADAAGAAAITRPILAALDTPLTCGDVAVDVPSYAGIACYPDHGAEAELLIQHADVARHLAAQQDDRLMVYDPAIDPHQPERLSLMGEMRHGLGVPGEFFLVYQPKVDLALGRIAQVEALVRWIHPRLGFLPPDRFIPLAEQTGEIRRLTAWLVDQAVEQARLWHGRGWSLGISINLSARDLIARDLPDRIGRLMAEAGLPAECLSIELTESGLMRDPEQALDLLGGFRDLGLSIAVDDYGTGYSSLSYLKRLPVDELKIDKSFVLGLASSAEDEVLVRSTVDLGHNLGLKVTAEGVEDQRSVDLLRQFDCDLAQGYFFAKPLKPADLERFLAESPLGPRPVQRGPTS